MGNGKIKKLGMGQDPGACADRAPAHSGNFGKAIAAEGGHFGYQFVMNL
jgi:hypothetical protein